MHLSAILNAARFSPYYRDQPWARRLVAGGKIGLQDIPITPKCDVNAQTEDFYCDEIPVADGRTIEKFTSGSTGEPIRVLKTQLHFKKNKEENSRLKKGWGFDQHIISIGMAYPDSNHPERSITRIQRPSGGTHSIIYSFRSNDIIDLLSDTRASCFYSRGSVALPVLQNSPDLEFLRLIATVGEVYPDEL